jgi:REP element-mobilizing transposase RayT
MKQITVEHGKYYHIYNRGNNGQNLFFENDNYEHFLRLMSKYIEPVTEIYAWVLLKNHFHLLVYIKNIDEIDPTKLTYSSVDKPKRIAISKQFSNLFNAYTLAINKRFERTGSLFEKNFERKLVDSEKYFQNLIYYIHQNPVKHKFVKEAMDYPWSSYLTILSEKNTKLKRDRVLHFFKGKENFLDYHNKKQNLNDIEHLIIE